jgi:arsenite methyltransferase
MTESKLDIWSQWLLHQRFGGDQQAMREAFTKYLYPWRDNVLDHANLSEGETLLDVGCGDGLIAFGALERVRTGHVIFNDISEDLLQHVQALAEEMNVLDRCSFLRASADDFSALGDASIEVVTTRSVLIYVSAKRQAFSEFYRILKPKGRLSIFEPINRFARPEPPHLFDGYKIMPVLELANKVKELYHRIQPATDPMIDFDERDLIAFAEEAGFREIHLQLEAEIQPYTDDISWETYIRRAGNPKIPTLEEAMREALTSDEVERFAAHLRPLVVHKQGVRRSAIAYLWATKQ